MTTTRWAYEYNNKTDRYLNTATGKTVKRLPKDAAGNNINPRTGKARGHRPMTPTENAESLARHYAMLGYYMGGRNGRDAGRQLGYGVGWLKASLGFAGTTTKR